MATKLEEKRRGEEDGRSVWNAKVGFRNGGWKCLGRISPFWPIVRLMRGGLHSCHARGDFLSARGVPTYIILDRQGSADVTTLPHVRERDRTIKRSTRMELSSKSRMHLMGPRDTRLALFSLLTTLFLSSFLSAPRCTHVSPL